MQDVTIRIAVLICTHNGEAHVDAQFESLAEQSHRPAAVFVHDWGSSDGTLAAVRRFAAAHDKRIPVVVQEHGEAPGAKDSFLRAIGHCLDSGLSFDYLALCDQDDLWSHDKLAVCAERIGNARPTPDLVYSDVRIVAEDGSVVAPSFYGGATAFQAPRDLRDPSILLANPVIGMTLCASRRCLSSIRRDLVGPWLMHDWAIVLLALGQGFKTEFVPRSLVNYRQHHANVLGAATGLRLIPRLKKARNHFARVRAQIALLDRAAGTAWPPLAVRILRGGALQRVHSAQAAFQSGLLGRGSRLLLGCAILALW